MNRKIKKLITSLVIASFLLVQNIWVPVVYALPDLPDSPELTEEVEQPDEPETTDETDTPDTPDEPDNVPQEESEEASTSPEATLGVDDEEEETDYHDVQEAPEAPDAPKVEKSTDSHTGENEQDGEVGDTTIDTGDADASGAISNLGNTNVATDSTSGDEQEGISILNSENGSDSENTGSVSVEDSEITIQDNDANLDNSLEVDSVSGKNSASKNVGNSEIDTGDANTSGTIMNSVNTNLEGAIVSEFNVVDDQMGDLILDYEANCVSGCSGFGGNVNMENSENGSDSENTTEVDLTDEKLTFQNNDADVENNLDLSANTGENRTDNNTGGDSTIETGDANVSGNVLNFLNNNIAGNVVYGVVNIFGELIGDIVVPEGYADTGVSVPLNINMANTGNGSGSENLADADIIYSDEYAQFNNADIVNNLYVDANTGENKTSANTGGDNNIETGDVNVDAQILNIANNNFVGGDWWLVLVNDAGNWMGRIFTPTGAVNGGNFAMSSGEASTNDNGDISVANNNNGAGSENTGDVTKTQSNTTVQQNNAKITNNISLEANTGDNSASRNTGGNSSIETGDANIQFNLVNFLNNNFAGGNVFLTVVNVFGEWTGDFLSPGSAKAEDNNNDESNNDTGVGGDPDSTNNNNSSSNDTSSNDDSGSDNSSSSDTAQNQSVLASSNKGGNLSFSNSTKIAQIGSGVSDENENLALADITVTNPSENDKKRVNLAWGLLAIPGLFILNIVRRRLFA